MDDAHGVIVAVTATPGSISEASELGHLIEQAQTHTRREVQTVIADRKYGTTENFIALARAGITTHLADLSASLVQVRKRGIYPEDKFTYHREANTYTCPAGQELKARRLHPRKRTWEYHTARGIYAARRDRKRRMHLMERSFADAANEHHFKRSRWRRLWRQRMQDLIIATVQNLRILLRARRPAPASSAAAAAKNPRLPRWGHRAPYARIPSPSGALVSRARVPLNVRSILSF